ncbi:MAG: carboxypeptidase-like regulatory domain-containing protein [Tannerella sp.]|jgi:hypothetical protein|nr:carboxypeptidase-like regulatory domain-containing protein [Tannerella sp.]
MRTKHSITVLLTILLLSGHGITFAQNGADGDGYYSISGVVMDSHNRKAVSNVNISAVGTSIGIISNEDGGFLLKIPDSLMVNEIELSCIGYVNAKFMISRNMRQNQTYLITPHSFVLSEVEVFSWSNPRDLVELAMSKVSENYSTKPNLLTGFYRETIQKRRNYIHISEAVIQVYKSSYQQGSNFDRSQVLKGRSLVSPKKSDTLDVKFLGGPNMPVYLDVVKNPDVVLGPEYIPYYSYRMGEATSINNRMQYVVHFQPQAVVDFPLYTGTLFIDRETLSFTRAEFSMDLSDKLKVTNFILKSKPMGLRFTPDEVLYTVTYKQLNDKTYLNYIRNEIRFKCDWKRRLFATNYTIVNETVVTDNVEENPSRIPARDAFSMNKSLSQEVAAYYDEDFWGAYNIIEPTESLENAVGRLKRQMR